MTGQRPKKRQFIEESSGEEFVHKTAWVVARRQLEHAERTPKGAQLDHMVAMMFAAHALEGYANFLGEKIAPVIWANERQHFGNTGVAGKLVALHEACGLALPEKGKRPWSVIRDLKRLRDGMAHPRTKTTTKTVEYPEGKEPPLFAPTWMDGLVSKLKAERALEDVKQIADNLHKAARRRFRALNLHPNAMDGILSMRSTTARLKEDAE